MREFLNALTGWAARRRWRGAVAGVAGVSLLTGVTALAGPAAQARPPQRAGLTASAAGTQSGPARLQARRGRFLGIIPSSRVMTGRAVPAANGTPPLTYHGGPVQHSSKVYAIFWQPGGHYVPPSYRAAIGQYFTDLSKSSYKTSNVYAAATQYFDQSGPNAGKNWVSDNITYGGFIIAADTVPASGCANYTMGDGTVSWACLTDAQLETEISHVISSHGLPTGLGYEYFLFTPKGMTDCFDSKFADGCYDPSASSSTAYCAYHSFITTAELYAVEPWADLGGGCVYAVPHSAAPNGDGSDVVINLISHEQNETMTDPLGSAWTDSSGFENGDECAWLTLTTGYNRIGDYSQTINGNEYLMQNEWSNRAAKCVASNTYPQPTGSFTAVATATAHGVTFTAVPVDSDDSTGFTYGWNFGDGQTALTATAARTHTYAAAGTYTVTLVIFDAHGDQVRVVKSVVVS